MIELNKYTDEVVKQDNRYKDTKFIRKMASFSLDKIFKDYNIPKSSFYKDLLSDEKLNFIKNKIIEYLFDE